MASSRNGSLLAAGDADGDTYLWQAATGSLVQTIAPPAGAGPIWAVAFGPGGTQLATATRTGVTYLWRAARSR